MPEAETSLLQDREVIAEFVIEAGEGLANIEAQLLAIEEDPSGNVDTVNAVFRAVHSIKGAAGFLDLKTIELLAHSLEQVLNHARNGELKPSAQDTSVLLQCIDRLKRLIEDIEASNSNDVSTECAALQDICSRIQGEAVLPPAPPIHSPGAPADAPPSFTNAVEQEALREFIIECRENLDQLDRDLLAMEREPQAPDTLASLFRSLHTLKGSSGFLGFNKLEALAHAGETLLGELREGAVRDSTQVASTMLELVDATRTIVGQVEQSGSEGSAEFQSLVERLKALAAGNAAAAPLPAPTAPDPPAPAAASSSKPAAEADHRNSVASESTIRVDVGLLDRLMNQVGELVLARNQILQHVSRQSDQAFTGTAQRLNLITTELQEGVMKTRMQPIGNVWSKFPRVVRDLALQLHKQVRIEMEGKETELDKTIIEAIKDPLTHLVRNSVDHGIERPEVRQSSGKPSEGCLKLRAYHEGGQVNIEIVDDGAGLNIERIRQRGVERGLMSSEQALRMSDAELAQLIFAPGFSTAEKVTNVSGRGVGMDVVRTNIEKIGGNIDIQSQPGCGTTIKIKIPLTLAIIPALMVASGGDRYAIPQASLLELVRLEADEVATQLERIKGSLVYRLRGRLLPLVSLSATLSGEKQAAAAAFANQDVVNIVVLRSDEQAFGLIVDQINDTEEIVVKPLAKQLKGVPVYAGATIMGDGRVALILDVHGLGQHAAVIGAGAGKSVSQDAVGEANSTADATQSLLVFTVGQRRLALPMSSVTRLEKIDSSRVELTDFGQAVQYRHRIMPLHYLGDFVGVASNRPADAALDVVVYGDGPCVVGIVVDEVIDIVETSVASGRKSAGEFVKGAVVVQNRLTDLLDVQALAARFPAIVNCELAV